MSAQLPTRGSRGGHDSQAPLLPVALAEDRLTRIIDIRSRAERSAGIGYIPGSRLFPGELLSANSALLEDAYSKEMPLAIVCQSGRRSAELCPYLWAAGFHRAKSLQGGMLGWGAAGLPTCAVVEPLPQDVPLVTSIDRFPRVLAACFVASTAEHAAEDPMWEGRDPAALVRTLVTEEQRGAPHTSVAVLERVLDRLAEIARMRGFPLELIQWNVDRMSAALRRIAA